MNKLFVYVEGEHDMIFVDSILSDYLRNNKSIELFPIPYAKKPPKTMNKDIKSKSKHNYLFLSDLDNKQFPCITARKENRFNKYDYLDFSNIIIVKEEIESWYLAGIDSSSNKFKGLEIPDNTEAIDKETFDEMMKGIFEFKRDCLKEIAKGYDFELAKSRNSSFKYFLDKLDEIFS